MKLFAPLLLLALPALQPSTLADVLVLEDQQAGAFLDLQQAIDAAPEGATLVLGEGDLGAFHISGKSLTLVRVASSTAVIRGSSSISGLAKDQSVVLRGLVLQGEDSEVQAGRALLIEGSRGAVRLEDCDLAGGAGLPDTFGEDHGSGGAGLVLDGARNVAISNSWIEGGAGASEGSFFGTGGDGGHAVLAIGSRVSLQRTTCLAGDGGTSGTQGGDGGSGYSMQGGRLVLAGSRVKGGAGGDGNDSVVSFGGAGGDGLFADLESKVTLVDNDYLSGAQGTGFTGNGTPGRDLFWEGGSLVELPGEVPGLVALRPMVARGESWALQVEGQPGDEVRLLISAADAFRLSFVPAGVWLVPYPSRMPLAASGVIPASGLLDLQLRTPSGPLPVARRFTAQAFVQSAAQPQPLSSMVQLLALENSLLPDCDGSGRADLLEVAEGLLADCDGNLQPDSCQSSPDCNGNGIPDSIDIDCFGLADEDGDGVPDVCQQPLVLYVDDDAAPGGDGSQSSPFRTLGAALDIATSGSEILVQPGLYVGAENRDLELGDRGLRIASLMGAATCTIDCEGLGQAFVQAGPSATLPVQLEGLTIRGGVSEGAGGALLLRSPAIITDCTFQDCQAGLEGGAIHGEQLTLSGCTFVDNEGCQLGGQGGGAVRGRVRASRCVFDRNSSLATASLGGAVHDIGAPGSSQLAHCVFRENFAPAGGAVGGTISVDSSFFAFNSAVRGGAIRGTSLGPALVTSSTFVQNSATGGASALSMLTGFSGGSLTVHNSIFWEQTSPVIWFSNATASQERVEIDFTALEGGQAAIQVPSGTLVYGASNVESDPLFVNPAQGDYRLGPGSPCLDAGSVGLLARDLLDIDGDGDTLEEVPLDLLLAPRRVDDVAPDVGDGPAPLPDMGALERG